MSSSSPEYRIRPFRDEDGEQVKALYHDEVGYSPMSMHRLIMRSSLTRPNSIICYVLFSVGIALTLAFGDLQSVGAVAAFPMSIASALFFAVHRWQLSVAALSFAKSIATDPDFKGISGWYGISRHRDGSTYLSGKSGFWVAELFDSGHEVGTGTIVGCVGLNANLHQGTHHSTAQLRRMAVSWKMRRQGVGRSLIERLIEHAREGKLQAIELQTNGHCRSAVGIYERLGWIAYETQGAPGKPWVDLWAISYRLEL